MYRFEERVGMVILLACTAILAGIVYWYPWYLCTYHSAPDDRYGFALMSAFPFWSRAAMQAQRTVGNGLLFVCGALLGLVGFSPLVMFAYTSMSR